MLVDGFGRTHESLRISVTDRCNIRCFYCMPLEKVAFLPRSEVLTFEEIVRVVRLAVPLGIRKIRITGGEPLVRHDLPVLIQQLAEIPGLSDLALTTNGVLLERQCDALRQAGLRRLNVSLDTLQEETFQRISRRSGLQTVLDGIAAAQRSGFDEIRINAVSMAGVNEEDLVPLARFCRDHVLHLRFIEFMPLDAEQNWTSGQVLTGGRVRQMLTEAGLPLVALERADVNQPAVDYQYADGRGRVGFINTISEPFCSTCNRLRMTAEGKFRNCLFGTEEWDVRALLRNGSSDDQIAELLKACVGAKKAGHGIDDPNFIRPRKAMYQIGG